MAAYLGDYLEDETLHFLWSTNDDAGASVTRGTNGTVSVYKDNGTTQSTAGVTDTEDFDSLTGVHACTIDLSADAFYATGADYSVVLSAATIDGQTVNAVLAHFSIENRNRKANVVQWLGSAPAALADTDKVQASVAHHTVGVAQTGDSYAIVNSGTHGNAALKTLIDDVQADSDLILVDTLAILDDTDDLQTTLDGLENLSAAEVNAEVADVIRTDTSAEPTGVPAATASLQAKVDVLYMMARNGFTVTASKKTFLDDSGAAEFEKDLSDDGTTYAETKANSV